VSSITQAKAEAQKLIKRYNQLQAEAKTADSAEAARKAAEADKLVSQISALQLAITKLQAKDRETTVPKNKEQPVVKKKVSPPTTVAAAVTRSPTDEIKRVASEKAVLDTRINRLEEAQKKTRAQIEQLTRARAELTRLKRQAEQSAATVAQARRANDEKLQQELAKLIEKKEAEHQSLKQELDVVRQQAQKDAEMLKVQRDAARAMMERQKQLEKEQSLSLQRRRSNKGWLLMVTSVAVFALILGILLALLFIPSTGTKPKQVAGSEIKETKNSNNESPNPASEKQATDFNAMETYRDRLKDAQGPLMVKLPGGTFKMGSKSSSTYYDERPQHQVTLQGFSISQYEVTFEEYDWFAAATGRTLPEDNGWGRGRQPVINVSWDDAMEYTQWLSEQTGYNYRLPSEREWEYAAQAGVDKLYWWGYKMEINKANCSVCGSKWDAAQTAPVGSFPPNPFGLYDTIGNVLEWTLSCFHSSYRGAPSTGHLWKGGDCSKRIARGSSFRSNAKALRRTIRHKFSPNTRIEMLGFRVVRVEE
jgi:formylglycine-generating enzyme required for sulfatase activity